jgi:dihydroneopterin aldolase
MIIALEGMKFQSGIGFYKEEQLLGNKIEVSVKMMIDSNIEERMDDINNTINYEEIYILIKHVVAKPAKLIEQVVKRIIMQIASDYPSIKNIQVRVSKINPPIGGQVERVWVEDEWMREI